jgi:hypothetical protein
MSTFVALLRAVNVGGRSVGMAELRRGLERLGFQRVQTYVQSGNVIFAAGSDDPGEHAAAIERLIERDFALEAKALVLTAMQMAEIAAANPFLDTGADERSLHATFLFEPVSHRARAAGTGRGAGRTGGAGGLSPPAARLRTHEAQQRLLRTRAAHTGHHPQLAHGDGARGALLGRHVDTSLGRGT